MSRHSGQNQFHGSTGQSRGGRGGAQTVVARHTIGAFECWCQGELCWIDLKTGLQTWPGKERGQAHPRGDLARKVMEMVYTQERLSRGDVKKYPDSVADLLLTLVNDCNIRCRIIDGGSMLLYPPDGESRPFKVIAARGAKQSLGFLHRQFISAFNVTLPEKEKESSVGQPTSTFTAKTEPVAPRPVAPAPDFSTPAKSAVPDTDSVWVRAKNREGAEMENWETNGTLYRCLTCKAGGAEWTTDNVRTIGGHTRGAHRRDDLDSAAIRAKSARTRQMNRMERAASEAVALLQEALGTPAHGEAVEALEKRVASLEAALAEAESNLLAAVNRADEAEARLSLVREQFNAAFNA